MSASAGHLGAAVVGGGAAALSSVAGREMGERRRGGRSDRARVVRAIVVRAAACLLFGVVVNVLVAWGIVLWTPDPVGVPVVSEKAERVLLEPPLTTIVETKVISEWGLRSTRRLWSLGIVLDGTGAWSAIDETSTDVRIAPHVVIIGRAQRFDAGWPLGSLRCSWDFSEPDSWATNAHCMVVENLKAGWDFLDDERAKLKADQQELARLKHELDIGQRTMEVRAGIHALSGAIERRQDGIRSVERSPKAVIPPPLSELPDVPVPEPTDSRSSWRTGLILGDRLAQSLHAEGSMIAENDLDTPKRPLPMVPVWPGALVNSVVFALPLALPMVFVWGGRRIGRIRGGRCLRCGYDLAGLTKCPECGSERVGVRADEAPASAGVMREGAR